MELDGRVVLVTGGARRVGRAIALRLARAGCQIAVHYRASAAEARQTVADCQACGVTAATFQADLGDPGQAARLVPAVLERFGRLDVLVNNASVFERMNVTTFDVADWERTLRVNLTTPMVLVAAAHEALAQAGGRVVNVTDAAVGQPWPEHLAYIVSKGALDTLTHVLARALAPGVNVVGIAPGVAAWPESYDAQTRARLTAKIPLQRAGSADDVAAAVEFVLRDGDYITGVVLPVDGGRHLA
ncbi:MAG: SDR family oxidoreductase [Phycisphaerae bacterium]|jgi:pteridine reductase